MTSAALPFVSVIVPTLDGGAQLADCVASLDAVDYPLDRRETLIVDAGSDEDGIQAVSAHRVLWLHDGRRNISQARNTGIQASRGDIVAFTDTDCVVSARWLRELVSAFDDPQVGAVAGAILPFPPRTLAERYAARRRSHGQERPLAHPRLRFAMTPNVAFRRTVFERIGAFDERFPGGGWEDADLCWRLTRSTSFTIGYAPAAVVFHRYRTTVREFFVQHYRYGYGLGLISRKYGDEVRSNWSTLSRAGRELTGACWSLLVAATHTNQNGDRDEMGFRSLDLVREVAQRTGYLKASLPGGPAFEAHA